MKIINYSNLFSKSDLFWNMYFIFWFKISYDDFYLFIKWQIKLSVHVFNWPSFVTKEHGENHE